MMLNRTWRIVLLVVALASVLWPDLIGASTWWIALAALTILLIEEITCSNSCNHMVEVGSSKLKNTRRRDRRR